MDQNNQPITQPIQPAVAPQGEKKVGPIVATLIIVLILIIAALYLFASKINQSEAPIENVAVQEQQAVAPAEISSENDVSALEAELDSATAGLEEQNF